MAILPSESVCFYAVGIIYILCFLDAIARLASAVIVKLVQDRRCFH